MARKRLFDESPPAVSSSEEEETDDQEEEPQNGTVRTQQNAAGEKSNDDEDGTEEDDDDEEEEEDDGDDDDGAEVEKKKPDLPSKTPKPNSVSASESDSDADSEDTESSQPPSPSLSGFTVKAILPKRKSDPKPEQPKKEKDADDKKTQKGAGPGTGGSQRIWSDEDEIVILNGMIKFQNEKGGNSSPDTGDFYGFVKESLNFNASNNQFVNKIRRLKKRYFTDVEKNESGKYETFSKPHDLECVELAKQIWGAGGIVVGNKSDASKNRGGNDVGGGGGGIVLAVAKLGSGGVNGKEKEASVKKGKRGSSEEVSGEGKQGILKKRKQVLSEEDDGGEGNVKKGKRDLIEESGGEGRGEDGKKENGKRVLSEEVNGERKGKGGKKEKQAANNDLNGREDANVKKQKSFVNGEWKESSMKKQKAVEKEEVEGEEGSDDLWDKYPHLRSSLLAEDLPEDVKERAMMMLGKVPEEKLVELEREWRSLMNAKLKFFMMEKDLIAKQKSLPLRGQLVRKLNNMQRCVKKKSHEALNDSDKCKTKGVVVNPIMKEGRWSEKLSNVNGGQVLGVVDCSVLNSSISIYWITAVQDCICGVNLLVADHKKTYHFRTCPINCSSVSPASLWLVMDFQTPHYRFGRRQSLDSKLSIVSPSEYGIVSVMFLKNA